MADEEGTEGGAAATLEDAEAGMAAEVGDRAPAPVHPPTTSPLFAPPLDSIVARLDSPPVPPIPPVPPDPLAVTPAVRSPVRLVR